MICERCGEKIRNGEIAYRFPCGDVCESCLEDMTYGDILEEAGYDSKRDVLELVGAACVEVDELNIDPLEVSA